MRAIMLNFLCALTIFGQIMETPVFPFESFHWGQTAAQITQLLRQQGKEIKERIDDPFSWAYMFPIKDMKVYQLVYHDTIFGSERVAVKLFFLQKNDQLTTVQAIYSDTTGTRGVGSKRGTEKLERLWSQFTIRFGSAFEELPIPFEGGGRRWKFASALVTVIKNISPGGTISVGYVHPRTKNFQPPDDL